MPGLALISFVQPGLDLVDYADAFGYGSQPIASDDRGHKRSCQPL